MSVLSLTFDLLILSLGALTSFRILPELFKKKQKLTVVSSQAYGYTNGTKLLRLLFFAMNFYTIKSNQGFIESLVLPSSKFWNYKYLPLRPTTLIYQ